MLGNYHRIGMFPLGRFQCLLACNYFDAVPSAFQSTLNPAASFYIAVYNKNQWHHLIVTPQNESGAAHQRGEHMVISTITRPEVVEDGPPPPQERIPPAARSITLRRQ